MKIARTTVLARKHVSISRHRSGENSQTWNIMHSAAEEWLTIFRLWSRLAVCILLSHNFMIEFFPQLQSTLESWVLPTFRTNCPDGRGHFVQMGSHFAQNTTRNPCSLLSRHTPHLEIYTYAKSPKPTPKTPFSWPELENGQNKPPSGQFGPQLGKMFEKWAKSF